MLPIARLGLTLLLPFAVQAQATVWNVTIITAPLIGHPAGPFSLDLQLIDGSGMGDGNNVVALTAFGFGGGSPFGTPLLFGDASGDLSSSVILRDTQFASEFTQQFMPGNIFTMLLLTTSSLDVPVPDEFSLSILDNTGTQIPTLALSTTGSDLLFLLDLGSPNPPLVFASDPTRLPGAGGPALEISAPQVTATPEPPTLILAGLGLAGILVSNRLRKTGSRSPIHAA